MDISIEKRIRDSFARQTIMATIGASITRVEPGEVTVELPFRPDLTQQHDFIHAGVVTMIVDSACGYAALTTMPPTAAVLSVEYKINFLASFQGGELRATGRVLKGGKRIIVTTAEVVHIDDSDKVSACAVMQQTLVPVPKTY